MRARRRRAAESTQARGPVPVLCGRPRVPGAATAARRLLLATPGLGRPLPDADLMPADARRYRDGRAGVTQVRVGRRPALLRLAGIDPATVSGRRVERDVARVRRVGGGRPPAEKKPGKSSPASIALMQRPRPRSPPTAHARQRRLFAHRRPSPQDDGVFAASGDSSGSRRYPARVISVDPSLAECRRQVGPSPNLKDHDFRCRPRHPLVYDPQANYRRPSCIEKGGSPSPGRNSPDPRRQRRQQRLRPARLEIPPNIASATAIDSA